MVLLKNFVNIFFVKELRKKVLFTLGVLIVYRLGNHIPVIGIDLEKLSSIMEKSVGLGGLFSYLDMFSGGSLSQGMLFALGIGPYITASIMMQMLGLSVPYLEQLLKEGELGRKKVNQYTRYLALGVAVLQSFSLALMVERFGLALVPGWGFRLLFMLSLTVGSMIVMWLGEQISLFGIGNGSSMIIFAGIVARFPTDLIKTVASIREGIVGVHVGIILLMILVILAASIVFLEKGQRKIPVQYTRRVVGQRVYGGQNSYIPFKINNAGVMPVIFASAVLNVPVFIINFLASRFESLKWLGDAIAQGTILNNLFTFLLIIGFSYFYTALVYNPEELADNIKKGGGFIPGIRPGKNTAEFFNYILTRLGLAGALYLGILSIAPTLIQRGLALPFYISTMSGTSLLIMVGVAMEMAAQVEAYLIEHKYEGFLQSGRLRSTRGIR